MAPSDVWNNLNSRRVDFNVSALISVGNLIEIYLCGPGPGSVAIPIYSFEADNERDSDIDDPFFHNITYTFSSSSSDDDDDDGEDDSEDHDSDEDIPEELHGCVVSIDAMRVNIQVSENLFLCA